MRTIGVLGGIGPQATMAFEAQVHEVAREIAPVRRNEGYPPLITVYMRHPPVLVGPEGKPSDPLTLDPRLLDAAAKLGCWAELIVIPSNTPHLFLEEIRKAAGCEVLSIVDVTFAALEDRGSPPVGLVGLGVPRVYVERLDRKGLAYVTAPESLRDRLDDAILALMEGSEGEEGHRAAIDAVASVRDAGASVTILGCTEIPLLLGADSEALDLIDPGRLLAEAAVRRAVS